ncbi:hypothetical protein SRB17_67520 [Streptomyces sp. RB17]|nr:hypothetical protein [Streptomyces sp. RB17]MQY38739.1 hypothetical protein [Streptomyces sp. RB17]
MPDLAMSLVEAAQMYPDRSAIRLEDFLLSYALVRDMAEVVENTAVDA